MKKASAVLMLVFSALSALSQTLYVPNGTPSGIGSTTSGNNGVGIGTASPGAMLEVKNPSNLGTSAGNNLLLNRVSGAGNANYFMNNTWLYRDANGADWLTARLHNGISIDGSFLTPGVDTRTWWERAPFHDIQSFGTGSAAYLTINAGNVGIGTTNPYDVLNVAKTGNNQLVLQDLSSAADGVGGGLKFLGYTNGTTGGAYFATIQGVKAPTSPGGILKLFTSDNVGNSFERLRIDNVGNVGIGTNAPVAKLTVGSYLGTMTSTTGIALGGDQNTIEFLNSNYGLGYGAKLYGMDQGNGLTSFRLAVRGNSSTWTDALYVKAGDNGGGGGNLGYIGIGSNNPDARLTVNGTVHSKEVKVDLNIPGPDYVFERDYKLPALEEIKSYIDQNKHLPEVPSAAEIERNGVKLGEMNMVLLKKVEELTLYAIEQKQRDQDQVKQIESLLIEVEKLKSK